jgi:Holliday junction resolvasome RuvABC endonuclease subunit
MNAMELTVLSVDPGLRSTGAYVSGPSIAEARRHETGNQMRAQALGSVMLWTLALIRETKPDVGLVEDYPFGIKNTRSLTTVAEVGGVVRAAFGACGVTVLEIPIQTWKQITIGHMPKDNAAHRDAYLARVTERYHRRFGSTDEADAFLMYEAMRVIWRTSKATSETWRKLRKEMAFIVGRGGQSVPA